MSRFVWLIAALALATSIAHAKPPHIDQARDYLNYGPSERILFWTPEQRIAGFRNIGDIRPVRAIETGRYTLRLPRVAHDFSDFRYELDGAQHSVDAFVDKHNIVGLLVIKDGNILLERYTSGNDESTRWISFSVAKSVVSMLVGAAIRDGYIGSADDPVTQYLPLLKGSSYDTATVKDILQMASGVEWDETYDDPTSDVNTTNGDYLNLARTLARKERLHEPGTVFNYNTGETNLVGALLRAAIGNNLASYLTHKIWQPFGMEHSATWVLDGENGGELGGCCISATLRDYGRIGLFALGEGRLADGSEVLTDGWMADSTAQSQGAPYYGYLWWLSDAGAYMALGIYGQTIFIDPARNLVIVTHSSWESAVGGDYGQHRTAFLNAMRKALD